jgi:hypothetical protein
MTDAEKTKELVRVLRLAWYNGHITPGYRFEHGTEGAGQRWLEQVARFLRANFNKGA